MSYTKEQRLINSVSPKSFSNSPVGSGEERTAIMDGMYLPNLSGDHSAGILLKTPTNDEDLTNKKYVDDEILDIEHGNLIGLGDDDHAHYLNLDQREGEEQRITGDIVFSDGYNFTCEADINAMSFLNISNATRTKYTRIKGGTNASTITLTLPNAVASSNKQVLSSTTGGVLTWESTQVPTGTITMYGGTTAPTGWLICDGSSYAKATYADLYAVIGNAFGSTISNFNVPDFRVAFAKGYSSGVNTIGSTGGQTSVTPTFTGSQLATHQHDAVSAGTPSGTNAATASAAIGTGINPQTSANNSHTHVFTGAAMATHQHDAITAGTPAGTISAVSTEPVYLVVNFIIKI